MKKEKFKYNEETSSKKGIEFCVNCDGLEDLAVTPEAEDLEGIKQRFHNCEHTGKFSGDICSRMFVAEKSDDPGYLFEEETE